MVYRSAVAHAIPCGELRGGGAAASLAGMSDLELCERYVALWNEPAEEARRAGVRALWREDGRHLLQAPVEIRERAEALGFPAATLEVRGHHALETRVARAYRDFVAGGEHSFRLRGEPTRVGDAIRVDWDMVDPAGAIQAGGTDVLVLDAEDRIRSDYQFIDQ